MLKNRVTSDEKLGDSPGKLRSQVALVLKDEELLDRVFERLSPKVAVFAETYAERHADGDQGAAQEASDSAMEKVAEFVAQLDTEDAQRILDPDALLAQIAHREVINHFRGRKEISLSHLTAKTAYTDETLWDDDERGGSGWSIFALPKAFKKEPSTGRGHKAPVQPFISRLLQCFLTPIYTAEGDQRGPKYRRPSEVAKEAKLFVDTMPDDGTAKLILGEYLLGYKPSKIAEVYGLKESNISRTRKHWFAEWGWDENKQTEVRFYFFLHNLADVAREAYREANRTYRKLTPEVMSGSKGSTTSIRKRDAYLQLLYRKVTTDHRTKAWLWGSRRDNVLGDDALGGAVIELEHFVGYLCPSGWGWNSKATKPKKYDSWSDDIGHEDDMEEYEYEDAYNSIHELC